MNAINYNKETEKIIAEIKSKKLRKKLFCTRAARRALLPA